MSGERVRAVAEAVRTAEVSERGEGALRADLEPIQSSSQISAARQANRENNVGPEMGACGWSAARSASRLTRPRLVR